MSRNTENALIAAFRGDTSIFFEQHGFCMHINTIDDFPLGAAIHQALKLLRCVVDEIEFESLGLPINKKESTYELEFNDESK